MKNIIFLGLSLFITNALFAYNFLFTAHSNKGVVAIANDKGEIFWSIQVRHPQQADISEDGKKIFVSEKDGARMIDKESKQTLWKYNSPVITWEGIETGKLKRGKKVLLENPVAQILEDDRFLVGNEGKSLLLEIDSKGRTLKTIKSESLRVVNHGEFRLASKDKRGRYIFPMLGSSLITIYDSDGKQIRRIETPAGVVSAQFLPDSTLLTGGIYGIIIYDENSKAIWKFDSKSIQKALNAQKPIVICDVKKLPSGNLLCTTYGNKTIPDILEISPDKKIIRTIDFPQYSHFSGLLLLDKNFKPIK